MRVGSAARVWVLRFNGEIDRFDCPHEKNEGEKWDTSIRKVTITEKEQQMLRQISEKLGCDPALASRPLSLQPL